MEEEEFARVLELFPIVRSRTYCEDDNSTVSTSEVAASKERSLPEDQSVIRSMPAVKGQDSSKNSAWASAQESGKQGYQSREDVFWLHLKEVTKTKLGPEDAQRFCDTFRSVHENLVHTISLESIKRIAKNLEHRMKQ